MEKKRLIQSVDRALELIEILAKTSTPLSAIEISVLLDINRTTAYGLINTLMEHEFIERDQLTNKYTIGVKLFELGTLYRFKLPFTPYANQIADSLVEKWSLEVHVGIYQNNAKVIFVLMHLPINSVGIPAGYVAPAYCTGIGKVLMSFLPDEVMESQIEKINFEKRTQYTISDKIELKKELLICNKQGYAKDNQEFLDGMVCLAAPIKDFTGKVVGAISISGPVSRISENEDDLIYEIISAAKTISTQIGSNN
ncbi:MULTISPECIES: IclR family transcriptional regulator [Clostridium]|uniref:IclR family transcriptional regulator n=1 Tax=Clostridium frigoriphilum TaxID=443253 RepID=A0ABU7UUD8_9CLOT|nr:IclR family transcriptional regulator [Clostridium sp. DSM 17811]MBU3101688.1 IclR family transcriptional regulator [Clostridium sp. DSM 17811]